MSDARELMERARFMPDGSDEKTALLDEAVRAADAANDTGLGYDARIALVNAAVRSGDIDKMLVAFTWCLAEWRRDPEAHDSFTILWYYKWAAMEAPRFPQISRQRIVAIFDDMERTYREQSWSLRPVYQHRHFGAVELGDLDDAAHWYEKWWAAPRDFHADCKACEHAGRVEWARVRKNDVEQVALAEELYRSRLKCAEVPHHIYGDTLMALVRLGRIDDAIQAHRTGMRMLGQLEHNVAGPMLEHILFLAVTGNLRSAQTLVARYLTKALAHKNQSERAEYFAGIALLCDQLTKAGRASWKLLAPAPLDVPGDARGNLKISALRERAEQEARKIAASYDARSGNDLRTRRITDIIALSQHAVDAPLRKRAAS